MDGQLSVNTSQNFPTYTNTITMRAMLGNMHRKRHVLIVLRDTDGNYLLGAKPEFYPENIFRFVGGGIDDNESPQDAALREIQEELQIHVNPTDLTPLAEVVTAATFEDKPVQSSTYLFELTIKDPSTLTPSDDIAYLQTMSAQDLKALINRYHNLQEDHWYENADGYTFCWSDYGEMYGFIHQLALDVTNNR